MQDELVQLLAGRRGHFRMESGFHSERWYELDRLLAQPAQLASYVSELASRLSRHRIDVICGPRTGGATVAAMLGRELRLPAFPVDRFESSERATLFPVRYELGAAEARAVAGQRVAIVDDAISAGSAVRGSYSNLLKHGAQPVAIGALFVFGDAAAQWAEGISLPMEAIARLPLGLWRPEDCPLCRQGLALEEVAATE